MGSSARGTLVGTQAKQVGSTDLMTSEQKKFLAKTLNKLGPQSIDLFQDLLGGGNAQQLPGYEDQFQQGVVKPSLKTYQQEILPALEQRYADIGATSSSAFNQALQKSAEDLSDLLSGQRIAYQQGQQNFQLGQRQLSQQAQMGALQQVLGLLGQRQFSPIVQGPQRGLLGDVIGAGASLGAAGIMASSKKVKENIRDYKKGLESIRNMEVKQYDYTIPVEGPQKDRVGLIAEEMPEELQADLKGIKAIDLYGLVAILVNGIKQLDAKVKLLEAR